MIRSAENSLLWGESTSSTYWAKQAAIVVGASFFVALCARVTLPLPFTPVPLTLLPVFNPTGPGGVAQLLGPTGGYLMAYPLVAGLAGWLLDFGKRTFARAAVAGLVAEIVLFASGIGWLALLTHSFSQAARFGLYWFVSAEVMKVMFAAALAVRIRRTPKVQA